MENLLKCSPSTIKATTLKTRTKVKLFKMKNIAFFVIIPIPIQYQYNKSNIGVISHYFTLLKSRKEGICEGI